MPNCFQLWRDGAAVPLGVIDDEMREHFYAPPDPDRFYESWYDAIGYQLAMGRTFAQAREDLADYPQLVEIADWLEARFTVRSWYETKGTPR